MRRQRLAPPSMPRFNAPGRRALTRRDETKGLGQSEHAGFCGLGRPQPSAESSHLSGLLLGSYAPVAHSRPADQSRDLGSRFLALCRHSTERVTATAMQRVRSLAVDLRTHARGSLRVIQAPRDCGTNDRSQGTAVIAGRRRAATMLQKGVSIAADATRRPRPIECLGQGIEVALPTPS